MKQHDESHDNRIVYEDPANMPQAEAWRIKLVEEISDINTQLSDKNKRDRCESCRGRGCAACGNTGSIRWSSHRYHTWRKTAITALRVRENVLRKLNAWIERHQTPAQAAATGDHDQPIIKAYQLLKTLEEETDDFDDEEKEIVRQFGEYLASKKVLQATGT